METGCAGYLIRHEGLPDETRDGLNATEGAAAVLARVAHPASHTVGEGGVEGDRASHRQCPALHVARQRVPVLQAHPAAHGEERAHPRAVYTSPAVAIERGFDELREKSAQLGPIEGAVNFTARMHRSVGCVPPM